MKQLSTNVILFNKNDINWKRKHGKITDMLMVKNKTTDKNYGLGPLYTRKMVYINDITFHWKPWNEFDTNKTIQIIKMISKKMELSQKDAGHLFHMFFARWAFGWGHQP